MAFNEHDNDPGPLRSTLARAAAPPAPPARGPLEFAPKSGQAFGTHEVTGRTSDPWCEKCNGFHSNEYICSGAKPPTFDTELRALAATATDRHPGAGGGDQRAVDRYRRPDGRAGDGREFNGPEPGMGSASGLSDIGAPCVGEPQSSAQQQIVRLRELVDAALVNLGQAHSAELAAAHDRVLAAEREISNRDGHIAELEAKLERFMQAAKAATS